jgi:hypothetical protein
MEIAKVDCSGLPWDEESGTFGGGTGMKQAMRDARDCLWIEYSEIGPSGVWILTAKPLKHGMASSSLSRTIERVC